MSWRYKWLVRWATLTAAGEGVQVDHHGSLAERLERLERELDRVGKRAEAERLLSSLEAGSERTRRHIEMLRRAG
jgi:hypothetical protein